MVNSVHDFTKIDLNELKIEKKEVDEAKKVSHKVPEALLGIGIRIEDDIVCTEKGPINLTKAVPREIEEVEDLCRTTPGKKS